MSIKGYSSHGEGYVFFGSPEFDVTIVATQRVDFRTREWREDELQQIIHLWMDMCWEYGSKRGEYIFIDEGSVLRLKSGVSIPARAFKKMVEEKIRKR